MDAFIRATLPDELLQKWLQHLRDFDSANPGCHFEIMADAPSMTMAEMVELLRLKPELKFVDIMKRKPRGSYRRRGP